MQSVVHLVAADETEQQTALAVARNLLEEESGTIDDVAVVVQGPAIKTLDPENRQGEQVRELIDDGVPVMACSNTLETVDMEESDLVDGVEVVPEGAVEVTRLQNEGYAYLRP